jgi:3'-phosphoadenosine 5'-phosphosulfate sulfotransferase (PAPS reductase)/FAD synthetase
MTIDLTAYDLILINTSAGKDSQAMTDLIVDLADRAGVRDRLVAIHADLGVVEWPGTRELAEEHAGHYGLRFEVCARDRDLLHQVEHERRKWPDNARRYCTSDQKTSQVTKVITRLVNERYRGLQVRVLNCLGLRAEESPARAKKPPFSVDKATNGKRHVDRWLPIHDWTEADVWARIAEAGTRPHPAYADGMPRLSCSFCVLSSKSALIRAAQLRPELAQEYVRIEAAIGHDFRKGLKIADIVAMAEDLTEPSPIEGWAA